MKKNNFRWNSFHLHMINQCPELLESFSGRAALLTAAKELKRETGEPVTLALLGAIDLHIKQKYDGYPLTEELAMKEVKPLILMLTSGITGVTQQ